MKKIYQDIWNIAKPIYYKARPFDVKHIKWMLSVSPDIIKEENLDEEIFIPLVILHDIGYSKVKNSNYWEKNIREGHMEEGAKMAQEILTTLKYSNEKTQKIIYYISVHDNWALGENDVYKKDKLLAIFNDLDFAWTASKDAFAYFLKSMNKTPRELMPWLEKNEKLTNRPFATRSTNELFVKLVQERNIEYKISP